MLADVISLFYPQNCVCCKNTLRKGEQDVCIICRINLPRTNYINQSDNPVAKLFWGRIDLTYGYSAFHFSKKGKLQDLIHQLKYKGNRDVGTYLGKEMGKEMKEFLPPGTFSGLVSVPLHPKKQHIRGYNQSDVIARGIAEITNIPVLAGAIKRVQFSESQTRKGKYERWQNVSEIFAIGNPELITDKHILLVDDVITTGATLENCAHLLLRHGAAKVSVAVAASGL